MKKVLLTVAFAGAVLLAADGKGIYEAQCKSCHGTDAATKALDVSAPLKGMKAGDMTTSLKGYKAGTLNKAGMGDVMKGTVEKLSDADIKAVAEYIATIK